MIPYYNGSIIFIATNVDNHFFFTAQHTDVIHITNSNYSNNINDYIPTRNKMPHLNEGLRMLYQAILEEKGKEIDDEIRRLMINNKYIIVRYTDISRFIKEGCVFYC